MPINLELVHPALGADLSQSLVQLLQVEVVAQGGFRDGSCAAAARAVASLQPPGQPMP